MPPPKKSAKKQDSSLEISVEYQQFVLDLKARVASARLSAARRINHDLIILYWDIGCGIVEKQQALGWGIGRGNGCGRFTACFPIHERILRAQRVGYETFLPRLQR